MTWGPCEGRCGRTAELRSSYTGEALCEECEALLARIDEAVATGRRWLPRRVASGENVTWFLARWREAVEAYRAS